MIKLTIYSPENTIERVEVYHNIDRLENILKHFYDDDLIDLLLTTGIIQLENETLQIEDLEVL